MSIRQHSTYLAIEVVKGRVAVTKVVRKLQKWSKKWKMLEKAGLVFGYIHQKIYALKNLHIQFGGVIMYLSTKREVKSQALKTGGRLANE